jgi:hypothetical protein
MKAPLTDHDLGIAHHFDSMTDKFRAVRKRAKLDEEDRHRKARRDKKEKEKVPKFKIGQEIVLTGGYRSRHYHLAEVIDFEEHRWHDFSYYGILKKTTEPEKFERIGRLIKFDGSRSWSLDYCPANVEDKKIKWLITPAIRLNGNDQGYVEPVK